MPDPMFKLQGIPLPLPKSSSFSHGLFSFGSIPSLRHCFHVFDHIEESIFFFDKEYTLVYINKKGRKLIRKAFGIEPVTGESVLDTLPIELNREFRQILDGVLSGRPTEYEKEIPSSKVWLHCRYFPAYDAMGEMNGVYGVVRDITVEKKIKPLEEKAEIYEQDLFQSRLLFEQFMQNSPLVAWLADGEGTMHYMNPVYLKTYGFSKDDFGKNLFELFSPQIAVDYHLNNQHVIKTGAPVEAVEKGMTIAGTEQIMKIYKFPLLVDNKTMVGGWAVDITEQVEMQDKLIKSIERHEYVNEATSDAIYDWDFSSGILYRSSKFEELFGYTERKISIRQRIKNIHPDDVNEFKRVVFSALRNTAVSRWEIEYRLRIADGEYRIVLDKAFIIRGNRKVMRVIGALQDVTPQKELQQKLVNQEKRNKRLMMKSIIETQEKERRQLSVELHDNVNQMLASCKLMLEVAKENGSNAKMLTGKAYQYIQTVIDEIRRISHDLNPSAIVDVGLVEAIEQLIETINLSGKINIHFNPDRLHYRNELTEEDNISIFRIVQEQLNNILKHANARNVCIQMQVEDGLVKMSIKDDGIGFNLSKYKKGLGLHNIYNRVEYYGGTFQIVTSEGNGCEMLLTLKTKPTTTTTQKATVTNCY
jgi:PAS domain S-box-containing protein